MLMYLCMCMCIMHMHNELMISRSGISEGCRNLRLQMESNLLWSQLTWGIGPSYFYDKCSEWSLCSARLDVLWCQPIKLIQVVSTSEFHEYWWNNVDFNFFCPLHLVQGLRSLQHWLLQKLSMKIFDQKFRYLIKNRYFGALIFQKT